MYTDPKNKHISLPDTVNCDMLSSSFWSSDDSILMTPDEIIRINDMNRHTSDLSRNYIWTSIGNGLELLKKNPFADGRELTPSEKKYILKNTAVPFVKEKTPIIPALALVRSCIKLLPCDFFLSFRQGEIYCDENLLSEILPFEHLKILHYSLDRHWCFVSLGNICGWTKCNTLAVCPSEASYPRHAFSDVLTVTARNLVLCESASHRKSDRLLFPMGTRIPLFKNAVDYVDGRSCFFSYVADIPVASDLFYLSYQPCVIPVSDDIIPGVLPLTSSNILSLAFKHLGCIYGWGGAFLSNDCSGFVRQIFRCFGFDFPRNSSDIASLRGLTSFDLSPLSSSERSALLDITPPGSILYFPGHIMLYLGYHLSDHFVISACSNISHAQGTDIITDHLRCVAITPLSALRKDGNTWLESLTRLFFFEKKKQETLL